MTVNVDLTPTVVSVSVPQNSINVAVDSGGSVVIDVSDPGLSVSITPPDVRL